MKKSPASVAGSMRTRMQRHIGRLLSAVGVSPKARLRLKEFSSLEDFQRSLAVESETWRIQRAAELALVPVGDSGWINGYCHVCGAPRQFLVDFQYAWDHEDGRRLPNWRERLECEGCSLNSRMRACIQIFEEVLRPQREDRIYITEQTTPLYSWLKQHYPNLVGSEFLDPDTLTPATSWSGLRHEDFTGLTFEDSELDFLLTFDVLEHVPDFRRALAESYRCLRPGGQLLLTAPFRIDLPKTLVRAELEDNGSVIHHLEPEYHGNPLDPEGCLCFYHFGWDLLDHLRAAGFIDVRVLRYWSRELGYMGHHPLAIVARKPAQSENAVS